MPKDRSLVRASDIGAWVFCNRAWWLANVKKVTPQNTEQLDAGTRAHRKHGQSLRRSAQLQRLGFFLLAVAMLLFGLTLLINLAGAW